MNRLARQAAFYLLLLGLWQAGAWARIWPPSLFPSPQSVAQSLARGFSDHSFWIAIALSMKRILIGYGISVVLGGALGMVIASNKTLEETLGSLTVSLQSLPNVCWVPLAALWFGVTERAILFVVVIGALLSVTISMESARKEIPKIYAMAGKNLGARGWKLFLYVLLPASLPQIAAGLKQGWAFAWRSLISGEMIYGALGLGQLLMVGRQRNDMSVVIAVMLMIVGIGVVADKLIFQTIEKQLRRRWGTEAVS